MNKQLFLLRGCPGSGKSTVAKSLSSNICEIDQYFRVRKNEDGTVDRFVEDGDYKFDPGLVSLAAKYCMNRCEMFMRNRKDRVVVANTFTVESDLEPYYKLAEKYGYTVFSLIVENRHNGVNRHAVPQDVITKMKNRFQVKL